eukprot:CAMPEP_0185419256 /NCGR_PEP_ID=MMETSP1365-20130426/9413_1 /TAXON_ID=38817 /ORGANISM="Gephyrocapsa oceanica, Strain RCC1303" /LENGTH=61 /DNA_ID=CAMNT_0028022775 /DNA_START=135 /DNA_END=317 /DNA_ORIENTATION=+
MSVSPPRHACEPPRRLQDMSATRPRHAPQAHVQERSRRGPGEVQEVSCRHELAVSVKDMLT